MFTSENLTLRNEESFGRNKVTDAIIMFEPRRKEKKRKNPPGTQWKYVEKIKTKDDVIKLQLESSEEAPCLLCIWRGI